MSASHTRSLFRSLHAFASSIVFRGQMHLVLPQEAAIFPLCGLQGVTGSFVFKKGLFHSLHGSIHRAFLALYDCCTWYASGAPA